MTLVHRSIGRLNVVETYRLLLDARRVDTTSQIIVFLSQYIAAHLPPSTDVEFFSVTSSLARPANHLVGGGPSWRLSGGKPRPMGTEGGATSCRMLRL